MRKLKHILFLSSILLFLAFNFQGNLSGWYQQFLPNTIGSQIVNDMKFIDSLNGYMITSKNVNPDTASILKTTDGGDNWTTVFSQGSRRFNKIKFINNNTGFVCGGTGSGTPYLYKTTNEGINWFVLNSSGCAIWDDMFVLNADTIWLVDHNGLCGGVYRTTNGGVNWIRQTGGGAPDRIYMYNARIGFVSKSGEFIRKTTNSGINWTTVSTDSFIDMCFVDSLTGWRAYGTMHKTTDGGLNWINQPLPSTMFGTSLINNFSVLNKDTVWGVGGNAQYPNGRFKGAIYTTTNGGSNWFYQVPDTSLVTITAYSQIQFINKDIGWAYSQNRGIHTKVGGDPLTSVNPISSEIPKQFKLEQNYPNPFNPSTIINYQLSIISFVTLKVFDLQGKEVQTLVNKKQSAGSYSAEFNGANFSSGIYFYTIQTENYKETKKMMLIK